MEEEQITTSAEETSAAEPSSAENEVSESDIENALDDIDNDTKEDNSEAKDDNVADEVVSELSEETKSDEPKDKEQDVFPSKFKKEDGTPDYDKLLTSYKDLESNFTKKTQELNEQIKAYQAKEEEAQQQQLHSLGYETQLDYNLAMTSAQNLAENYAGYLQYTDDPEYVRSLLISYANNPDQGLLEEIEDNFGVDIIKEVTKNNSIYTNQLVNQYNYQQQNEYTNRITEEAREYVTKAVNDYPEWFDRQEFVDFFGDALKVKGDTFAASAFVEHVQKIWDLAQKSLLNEMNKKKENSSTLRTLSSQTPKSATLTHSKDLSDMSDDEISSAIQELI